MYVDGEHNTWGEVFLHVMFAYNTAAQETTSVRPFQLFHGRRVTTLLDSNLTQELVNDGSLDAHVLSQRAEYACQVSRQRIQGQQHVDASR